MILDAQGRVLLVRHSYGELNWEVPGGAGEIGESAADAAIREVREETGLEVVVERMTGIYYEPATRCHHFVFRCRPSTGAGARPSSAEITELGWWKRTALPRPISDFTVRRIDDALSGAPAALHEIRERKWLR